LLLIAKTVLFSAIRALPGYSVTCHTPLIVIHAFLADGKSTPAIPAEHKGFSAAMADL
jgi:hypothetical protein